ncbi:glucose-1-phosphate cytidylyltransferase [Rhodobacterales bacterium HKCCE3408]|nr:glucose-1-phosphate cytidylyltransferase [Rhodobacterales bacterium HKCCE3408]
MKAVILAGGLGTRISEESHLRPKPMIEIGGRPILWHIMKHFGHHGITDFVICCGYKGYLIKEYFANYFLHMSDITFDIARNSMEVHQGNAEPWRVTLVDTGEMTQTAGRLKRVRSYLSERFIFTYGDGVSNIDLSALLELHVDEGTEATVTAVQPAGRFGSLGTAGNRVTKFAEKPKGDGQWVSGGFFVLEPSVIDRIEGDSTIWEREPVETLAADGQLSVYRHTGFWAPMDTMRDKAYLEQLWSNDAAPWKTWD